MIRSEYLCLPAIAGHDNSDPCGPQMTLSLLPHCEIPSRTAR